MYDVIENFYELNEPTQLAVFEVAVAGKEFLYFNDLDAEELEFVWSNATDEPWSLIFPWRVQSTTVDGHKFAKYFVARDLLGYLKTLFVGEELPVNPYENLSAKSDELPVRTLSLPLLKALRAAESSTVEISGGLRNEALAHCFHSSTLLRVRGSVEFDDTNPLKGTNTFEISDRLLSHFESEKSAD